MVIMMVPPVILVSPPVPIGLWVWNWYLVFGLWGLDLGLGLDN